MRMTIISPFGFLVVALATHPALGQTLLGTGSFGGTLRDESGAMVADARINLREESKGLFRDSRSDRGGSFLFPAITAGVYSVRVEKQGFSPEQIDDLRIDIGEQASLVIILRPEELRTTITV